MEQTNLVVTGDGKTWDEVTRDVSYIGDMRVKVSTETNMTVANTIQLPFYVRGADAVNSTLAGDKFTKDFAIAYDRFICLVDGHYRIEFWSYIDTDISANTNFEILKNGTIIAQTFVDDASKRHPNISAINFLKRGDYIQYKGCTRHYASAFDIIRVG